MLLCGSLFGGVIARVVAAEWGCTLKNHVQVDGWHQLLCTAPPNASVTIQKLISIRFETHAIRLADDLSDNMQLQLTSYQ